MRIFRLLLALVGSLLLSKRVSSFQSLLFSQQRLAKQQLGGGSLDYEYLPPNNDNDDAARSSLLFTSPLPSSYPDDTPSGLRGEAVRSALRSKQCIAYHFDNNDDSSSSLLNFGLVQVQGKGCLDFLHNQLTLSFDKNPKAAASPQSSFQQACLLTAKGRLVDRLGVAVVVNDDSECEECAYLLTSPGHDAQHLLERLDRFVFPLDKITMQHQPQAFVFTLASTKQSNLETVFEQQILPFLNLKKKEQQQLQLPKDGQCVYLELDDDDDDDGLENETKNDKDSTNKNNQQQPAALLILPTSLLPSCAAVGTTFCFLNDHSSKLGQQVWTHLVSPDNAQGPVEVGALEFDTLRIQAGQPAFGYEVTAAAASATTANDNDSSSNNNNKTTPASPLELHMDALVDFNKGCYLGQEGIAAVANNPRGPPRTLYQVVFEDEFNLYQHQTVGEKSSSRSKLDNLTRPPRVGDLLYVLGSHEEIPVGTVTSVAEPGGTGDPVTLGLALVRRADSILKQMKDKDLTIPSVPRADASNDQAASGIISPSLDPLDGLEVIIGRTFTVGTLKTVPSRRFRSGQNMFEDEAPDNVVEEKEEELLDKRHPMKSERRQDNVVDAIVEDEKPSSTLSNKYATTDVVVDNEPEQLARAVEEAQQAQVQAEAAAAEAKRKAEKMELLRKRAEEAMALRKKKKKAS